MVNGWHLDPWNGLDYKLRWKDTQKIEVVLDIDNGTVSYYKTRQD